MAFKAGFEKVAASRSSKKERKINKTLPVILGGVGGGIYGLGYKETAAERKANTVWKSLKAGLKNKRELKRLALLVGGGQSLGYGINALRGKFYDN